MTTNKKIKCFVLLNCFLCMSCLDNSKKLHFLISNNNIKYWNYNMIRGEQNVWFTFSFDKNGNVIKYSFNKKDNKRWLFADYGYDKEFKWSVSKDSIFKFMGNTEKIMKFSGDTLFTFNLEDKEIKKYVCVKGNLNIQE